MSETVRELDELRDLLFGQEKARLGALQERIDDPVLHATDVSHVLPQAVVLANSQGRQLSQALAPTVEIALRESVKRDPSILATAIFPVIGPAVRKAIAEAFQKMMQTLSQALDHSFSIQGLKWRIEALRTGRPFAEVVLLHTLRYRVEQLFLIHRETSLPLLHLRAAEISGQEPGAVSGMLSAIQDFAHDSFRLEKHDRLETMQLGELSIWIETGPLALVAAVIRGHAPLRLRDSLREAIEKIHRENISLLERFNGDNASFVICQPAVEPCFQSEMTRPEKKISWRLPALACIAALLALLWWGTHLRDRAKWARYLERLRAEDGIVVAEARKSGRDFYVSGLRDPLAAEPERLLEGFKIEPSQVKARWTPFFSLSDSLIGRRAEAMLHPPEGVKLSVLDGKLTVEGAASANWTETARRIGPMIPGVVAFDDSRLEDPTAIALNQARLGIEELSVQFGDQTQFLENEESKLTTLKQYLAVLQAESARRAQRPRLRLTGHADRTGLEESNDRLSVQRAEQVAAWLAARGVDPAVFDIVGAGSRQPTRRGMSAEEERLNRRVTFQVTFEESKDQTHAMKQKKVCLLGGFAVGKTCLVTRFVRGIFDERYLTTIGVKIDRKDVPIGGQNALSLMIWDIAGEDVFHTVEASYLRGAAGYLLVADSTRRGTLDHAIMLQKRASRALGSVPFLMLVNKIDLEGEQEIEEPALDQLRAQTWPILKTSAKTGAGVEEAFASLAGLIAAADRS